MFYDIADAGLINILHSRAAVWNTVRNHLTALHRYSFAAEHVGYQMGAVYGLQKSKLEGAPNPAAAALILHQAVAAGLGALTIPRGQADHARLRGNLVKAFAKPGVPVSEPFDLICERIADQALAWYGTAWPAGVALKVQSLGSKRSPFFPNNDFWINAHTVLPADVAVAPTVVLRLAPEELNLQTYAAIFAVLVHEFVCHVAAPRGDSSNESPFAEGFCDWAAKQLFCRWLDDVRPALFAAAMRRFGEEVWALGMAEDNGNAFWDVRVVGHDAAANAVAIFRDAGRAAVTAMDETIVLARDLAVLAAPLVTKDNFVRRLAAAEVEDVIRDRLTAWSDRRGSLNDVLPPY